MSADDPKPATTARAAPKKRSRPRKPTGRGKGRHNDCPWDEVERLYVQGDIAPAGKNAAERVWPSSEELAARFRVSSPTVRDHARLGGWTQKREEFRRKLAEAAEKSTADFVAKATTLWREEAQKIWDINVALLDEAKFATEFHKSGQAARLAVARASTSGKGRSRPSGGDADAQGDGPPPPEAQVEREPMPARDAKDYAVTVKTARETMLAMLVGAQQPGTVPVAGGQTAAPAALDPRAAAVIDDFVLFSAERNKNPAPPGAPA